MVGYLLFRSVQRTLGTDPAKLRDVVSAITNGDYSSDFSAEGPVTGVFADMQSMQANLRERIEKDQTVLRRTGRISEALDNAGSMMMIADANHDIVFMNKSLDEFFSKYQSDIRKDLPSFDTKALVGGSIDRFHKNPAHQRGMVDGMREGMVAHLDIGGRKLQLQVSPIFGNSGERTGTVVEWFDRTKELSIVEDIRFAVSSAQNGDLTNRVDLEGLDGVFLSVSKAVNELLEVADEVVSETVRVLKSLSTGDLSEMMDGEYNGSFKDLKEGANGTVTKLQEVVSSIQVSAGSVKTGAGEISLGNTNLSQRTEEQASSLEETASSMQQMTDTVKQNADNASQANQLALAARDQASKGGDVVSSAVSAMQEIDDSSKKISDIIGVIDEIAFQTNLLALNASVEAARAGDQGRGFAVVASEVRNLAGRSATAAKEIKDLIEDSSRKVAEGSRLVNESGETLREIVGGVKKVTDIVGEIAEASQEQATGIDEVNKAISVMDELTQQNAALVEQAAAASESLGEQADDLNQMMSFFSLSGASSPPAEVASSGGPNGVERRSADRPWSNGAQQTSAQPVQETVTQKVANGDDQEWEEF